jgi:hypothetical protein
MRCKDINPMIGKRNRPAGLMIVGILVIIICLWLIFSCIYRNVFIPPKFGHYSFMGRWVPDELLINTMLIESIILCLIFICGIGILFFKNWARIGVLIVFTLVGLYWVYWLIAHLLSIIISGNLRYLLDLSILKPILLLLLSITIICYLISSKVNEQFTRKKRKEKIPRKGILRKEISGKSRSAGVTVVGIIMVMYSLICLVISANSVLQTPGFFLDIGTIIWITYFVLSGSIYFISSINILRLKNWARVTAVSYSFLILALKVLLIYSTTSGMLTILYLPFYVFNLLFLIFFTRPKIKEQFR